jgi:ribulose-5-phosphate 4-epimerase/fuculose-1-phosphate aldolase
MAGKESLEAKAACHVHSAHSAACLCVGQRTVAGSQCQRRCSSHVRCRHGGSCGTCKYDKQLGFGLWYGLKSLNCGCLFV